MTMTDELLQLACDLEEPSYVDREREINSFIHQDALVRYWKSLPKALQYDPIIVACLARRKAHLQGLHQK